MGGGGGGWKGLDCKLAGRHKQTEQRTLRLAGTDRQIRRDRDPLTAVPAPEEQHVVHDARVVQQRLRGHKVQAHLVRNPEQHTDVGRHLRRNWRRKKSHRHVSQTWFKKMLWDSYGAFIASRRGGVGCRDYQV